MEKKEHNMKENVVTGVSSLAGAAVGIVAGSVLSQSASAAEVTDAEEISVEEVVTPRPTNQAPSASPSQTAVLDTEMQPTDHLEQSQPSVHDTAIQSHENVEQPQPSLDETTAEPETQTTENNMDPYQVEVVSYETLDNSDGSQMDVAVVTVDGQAVVIADLDRDGQADFMAADFDGNEQLDDYEFIDITEQGIAMHPFQPAIDMNAGEDFILSDSSDYINDANIDDYMA